MRIQNIILASITALSLLSGCGTPYKMPEETKFLTNLNEDNIKTYLTKAKTTKSEVIKQFGIPTTSDVISENEIKFTYLVITTTVNDDGVPFVTRNSYQNKMTTLKILFKNDVVINYDLNIKDEKSHWPLARINNLS
jgi:outer membrane protein assembly factor BamE (lipoprotein component of BamABCDE complex)